MASRRVAVDVAVVVEKLSPVRVELARPESVIDSKLVLQGLQSRAYPLHRHTTTTDRSQDESLSQTDERYRWPTRTVWGNSRPSVHANMVGQAPDIGWYDRVWVVLPTSEGR